jgi:hyperosmotically inducible protein
VLQQSGDKTGRSSGPAIEAYQAIETKELPMNRNAATYAAMCALAAVMAVSLPLAKPAVAEGAGETTGEYVDDSMLTTKVKAALLAEKNLKSLDISVESTDGVVTLSGAVVSSAQIKQAVDVAKHVKGVKDVHNSLTLKTDR